MRPTLVVAICGLAAAALAFAISATRKLPAVPDVASAERAVRRSIWRHPRVRRFLTERVDRKAAGGFLLTISVGVLFAMAFFLGVILDLIDNLPAVASADRWVAAWGSRNGTSTTADAMKMITHLGSTPVIASALLITAGVDYARRRSSEVFAFVAAIGLGELLLNNLLKLIVHRERPSVLRLVTANGYSFPSGHTAAATAGWLAIALVFSRDRSRLTRSLLIGCAALIAFAVATSRALLGVHWLTDVIGGLALGAGWFLIVAIIFGGRAQRLGDPVSDSPHGVTAPPESPPK